MTESYPSRPEHVPAEAQWDNEDHEWFLGKETNGVKTGPWTWWRADGHLLAEASFDEAGKLHGDFLRYHPDGAAALKCEMIHGLQGATILSKSVHETDQSWSSEAENIVRIEISSKNPGMASGFRYFTKDGAEVSQKGKPIWPRPKNVPDDAMFISGASYPWVQGDQVHGSPQQSGLWTWWEADGTLRSQKHFNENGKPLWSKSFSTDGTLYQHSTSDPETGKTVNSLTYHMSTETVVDQKGRRQLISHSSTAVEKEERFMEDGRPLSHVTFDEQGQIESAIVWDYKGKRLVHREDKGKQGVLIGRGDYDEGKKAFYYAVFFSDGRPFAHGEIANGLLVGSWQFNSQDGKIQESHDITTQEETESNLIPRDDCTVVENFLHLWTKARLEKVMKEAAQPAILAGVDSVHWEHVAGCWGNNVAKFPFLLKAMTVEDRAVQKLARGIIFDECCHQTSTYEATGRVIPYFIKLLPHPTIDRVGILEDLIEFGDRCLAKDVRAWGKKQKPDSAEWMSTMGVLEGLAQGDPAFLELSKDKDPDVRKHAITLLKFSKNKSAHTQLLGKAARSDPSREFRINAASELIILGKVQALAQQDLLGSDDFMMRSIAAMTMACVLGDQTPPKAFPVLKEAFDKGVQDKSIREEYNHFRVDSALGRASFLAHIVLGLGAMRCPEAMALIPELCQHIDDVDGLSAEYYGKGLLGLALGDGTKPMAKDFVMVLETLSNSEKFYTFINVNDVLDQWRLPHNVMDLKALIAEVKSAPDPEKALRQKLQAS